jgi:hypothetical protein
MCTDAAQQQLQIGTLLPAHSAATHLRCVDNAHVHALQAGVVQEGAVEGAPHCFVATEGEGNIGHTAADLAARAHTLDLTSSAEEVHCVVVVLWEASAHCEDVGVKNNVLWLKPNVLNQDAVCALAHAHLQDTAHARIRRSPQAFRQICHIINVLLSSWHLACRV